MIATEKWVIVTEPSPRSRRSETDERERPANGANARAKPSNLLLFSQSPAGGGQEVAEVCGAPLFLRGESIGFRPPFH